LASKKGTGDFLTYYILLLLLTSKVDFVLWTAQETNTYKQLKLRRLFWWGNESGILGMGWGARWAEKTKAKASEAGTVQYSGENPRTPDRI